MPTIGLAYCKQNFNLPKLKSSSGSQALWFLKNITKRFVTRSSQTRWHIHSEEEKEDLIFEGPNNFFINLTSSLINNWRQISSKRTQNANLLYSKFKNTAGWSAIITDKKHTPYLVGMLCDSKQTAKRRYQLLNKRTQIVMRWPDLPSELRLDLKLGELEKAWNEKILFFFVHQGIVTNKWLAEIDKILQDEEF